MKAEEGSNVKVHYRGTFADGTEFDNSRKTGKTFDFKVGTPGLSVINKAVLGMTAGESKTITFTTDEAYGQVNPDQFRNVPKSQFEREFIFEVGAGAAATGPAGPVRAVIREVHDGYVVLDFNHPLAGKDLTFEVEMISVEPPERVFNWDPKMKKAELYDIAKSEGLDVNTRFTKAQIIEALESPPIHNTANKSKSATFNLKDYGALGEAKDVNWGPLLQSYIEFCDYKKIVEIGVQYGGTTEHFCRAAKNTGGKVYGYDFFDAIGVYVGGKIPITPPKTILQEKLKNKGYDESVVSLTKVDTRDPNFSKILKEQTGGEIDFAFIDGCHSYAGVKNDFLKVYPLLSPEGTIVFHDTFSHTGPRRFILDLYEELNDGTFDVISLPFGRGPGAGKYNRIGLALIVKRSFAISGGGIINTDHDIIGPPETWTNPPEVYAMEKEWYERQLLNAKSKKEE